MSYDPKLYIHDMDKKAFAALNAFPAFTKLREIYDANVDEKAAKIDFMSTAIRLGEDQMPEIYNQLPPICEKLEIEVPELYYKKSKELNAETAGTTHPYICITSKLVEIIPNELIGTVLAHECGHIACKHNLYWKMAMQLMDGVDSGPLARIPEIRRFATPAIIKTLLFWSRCSEMSADRAAVLCDGGYEKTIDLLLRINEYDDNVNREAFLKQALDLRDYVGENKINKAIEIMLTSDETHPRLAMRASECYEWYKSEQCTGIVAGTYTIDNLKEEESRLSETTDTVDAEVSIDVPGNEINEEQVTAALQNLNNKLERYTNHADKLDYELSIASGIIAGIVDSFFVGEFSLEEAHEWGKEKTENFIVKVAKWRGFKGEDVKGAIVFLAEKAPHSDGSIKPGFHMASDTNTNDFGGGNQHHLRDFAHHATPVGLLFSILTQFTGKSYGTDTAGNFIVVEVRDKDFIGKDVPQKLMFGIVYWFFHLLSDVSGSGKKDSEGTGIPGPLLSIAKMISATPFFKNDLNEAGNRNLSVMISKLFNGTYFGERDENGRLIPLRFDFRTELGIMHFANKQLLPVLLNEAVVRSFYLIRSLVTEITQKDIQHLSDFDKIDWNKVKPWGNRTIERMLMISSMTFNVADTADAAVHAAIESGGNWVLFAGKFVCRYNYIGAGRAALAVVREVSNEMKEAQLIHEKMILTEIQTAFVVDRLERYKAELEQRLSDYLAEDIEAFIEGFDDIKEGLAKEDSDLVIKGNVRIQKVLGREPQFTNQKEFDNLMTSSEAFVF